MITVIKIITKAILLLIVAIVNGLFRDRISVYVSVNFAKNVD